MPSIAAAPADSTAKSISVGVSVPIAAVPTTAPADVSSLPPWDEPGLAAAVRTVVGRDRAVSLAPRLTAIRSLGRDLGRNDADALQAFLSQPSSVYAGLSASELNTVKNDTLDILLRQESIHPRLAGEVLRMAGSSGFDSVCRQYCVQHLPELRKELSRGVRGSGDGRFGSPVLTSVCNTRNKDGCHD